MKPNRIQIGRPGRRQARIAKPPASRLDQGTPQSRAQVITCEPRDLLFLQILVTEADVPIVDLTEKYGVQDAAPRANRDDGVAYGLGSGTSCTVVQHETDETTEHIVPKGTIVALKRYTVVEEYRDMDLPSSKALATAVWQDLRLLCHPYLGSHENITKLLYLAWEPHSMVPLFGLELAAYGTLQDAIESEFEMSLLQVCNISMDVAVGIHAFHACGFVHGDIKPSNVMLQKHPTRQIVAKLLDFSGATGVASFDSTHQQYITKLWLAPEVLLGRTSLDWMKIDVYAYGLLLAQLWATFKKETLRDGEHFLKWSIPKYFKTQEKEDLLLYYKCCPETEDVSALNQALRCFPGPAGDSTGTDTPIAAHHILRDTLSPEPILRRSMTDVISHFKGFAESNGRELPGEINRMEFFETEKSLWSGMSDRACFVFHNRFSDRPREHQRMVLRYMMDATAEPVFDRTRLTYGEDDDYRDASRLWRLVSANELAMHSTDAAEYYWRNIHFQIAVCHFVGYGTCIDERKALRYHASAALGFVRRAMFAFPSVEESCLARLESEIDIPRRLLLIFGHFYGCHESSDMLRLKYPETFEVARLLRAVVVLRGSALHISQLGAQHCIDTAAQERNPVELVSMATSDNVVPALSEEPPLFMTVKSGNANNVRSVLSKGADPKQPNSEGLTILHALALISDDEAAEAAPILLAGGADPTSDAQENQKPYQNGTCCGLHTPIYWAIAKNRPLFFGRLMDWFGEHGLEPERPGLDLFNIIVHYRRHAMLRKYIAYLSTQTKAGSQPLQLKPGDLWLSLLASIEDTGLNTLDMRWSHGKYYRQARADTVNLLLQLGADPMYETRNRTALGHCIVKGDGTVLRIFLDLLETEETDITQILGRTGILARQISTPASCSALLASTHPRSREAFDLLLDRFPYLVNQASREGYTPLSVAIEQNDERAVRELLAAGANLFVETQKGSTPFFAALASGHLHLAKIIVETVDEEGLQRLLFQPNKYSRNTFGALLATYLSGRRSIRLQSFDFLRSLGGCTFYVDADQKETVWRSILINKRPVREDHVLKERALLQLFLHEDMFLDKINFIDWTGRAPLHYAASYGYLEAAAVFIKSGADINLKCGMIEEASESKKSEMTGWTALAIAVSLAKKTAPDSIIAGTAREIKAWQGRLVRLIQFLSDNGGELRGGFFNSMEAAKIKDPDGLGRRIHVSNWNEPADGDQTWRGKWPERFPTCSTIAEGANNGISTWNKTKPNGYKDEAWLDKMTQPIIHVSRRGRRKRMNNLQLFAMGAFIDSSSDEENKEVNADMYKRLKAARDYISSKLK